MAQDERKYIERVLLAGQLCVVGDVAGLIAAAYCAIVGSELDAYSRRRVFEAASI
jgi:hypothetical protein